MPPRLTPASSSRGKDVPWRSAVVAAAVSCVVRAVWGWSVPLLGLLLLVAGCTTSPSGQGPSGVQGHQSLPSGCAHTVTRADDVSAALDAAAPGSTVCFSGGDLADTDVTMTRSGTAEAPITLAADGSTVREVQIKADHVILEGFTVTGGGGVLLEGAGIIARNNTVHDTRQGGITCHPCTDSTIEFNTMTHVATNGIDITGQRITVHANTISDTAVGVHGGDADGMRFYGNGHRITGNTIFDISASGYDSPPHPDCFQTLDNDKPPTFDVVISGNTCRNVDAQCLIATGDQDGNSGAPSGAPSITFVGNMCANNGAQAVNVRRWPDVVVRQNTFSGPNLTRAVLIAEGSTDCTVVDNVTTGGRPTVEVDDSSQQGSHVDDNRPA
ncbi:MAG: right-handed parallel beta-helix repeat-containing protein [Pseudonocardiales bacterium]|nr:right-handed parallel beta-helix repeat-containing protein [Pseudonocardiales bacterium]MBV9029285.1 right-handed parallel beta-helix repeat-containing protein [Pseudonocardiales bacterium]MBW0009851.1 right-handed parallel beta-helix repeat-containing protein [Pseudonocardiales bacterium]